MKIVTGEKRGKCNLWHVWTRNENIHGAEHGSSSSTNQFIVQFLSENKMVMNIIVSLSQHSTKTVCSSIRKHKFHFTFAQLRISSQNLFFKLGDWQVSVTTSEGRIGRWTSSRFPLTKPGASPAVTRPGRLQRSPKRRSPQLFMRSDSIGRNDLKVELQRDSRTQKT